MSSRNLEYLFSEVRRAVSGGGRGASRGAAFGEAENLELILLLEV